MNRIGANNNRGSVASDHDRRRKKILNSALSVILTERMAVQRGGVIQKQRKFTANRIGEIKKAGPTETISMVIYDGVGRTRA